MNILFLTCWYPTKAIPSKGIFIKEHAAAIQKAGNKVIFIAINIDSKICFFEKKETHFTDENGVETYHININSVFYKWIYSNPFMLFRMVDRLYRSKLLSAQFDIIHSNILMPCAIVGDMLSKKYSIPHVITEHWSKVDRFMKGSMIVRYGKRAYDNAACITSVSSFLETTIQQYVKELSKIKVIPNIVDTGIFTFKEKADTDKIIFSAISFWERPKDPFLFIDALNVFQKKSQKIVVLNIAGLGPLLPAMKAYSKNVSYEINFLGKIEKTGVAKLFHESGYFLHASNSETFGIVVVEALATGTPVVASDVAALPELINKENGVTCNNTIEEWQKAIDTVVNSAFDRKKISEGARKKYGYENVGRMFNEVYASVR